MSEQKVTVSGGQISIMGLLGATLVVLKLLKIISISWFWVLAPFWLPIAVVLGILALVAGGVFVVALVAALIGRPKLTRRF